MNNMVSTWGFIGSILGVVLATIAIATIIVKARYSDAIRVVCAERFLNMDGRLKKVEGDIDEIKRHTGEFKVFKEVMEARFSGIERELRAVLEILKELNTQTTELRVFMKAQKQTKKG